MGDLEWLRGADENRNQSQGDGEIPLEPEQVFPLLWGVLALLLVVWGGATAYFTVEANEEAVILRLGEVHKVSGPGFHGKAPFGIDRVFKGAVKTVHQAEFGYRTVNAGVKSQFNTTSPEVVAEATMLTGDLNLVLVNWEIRYKIKSLKDYLFEVRDPVGTLRAISEAVMRTEIGDRSVDEALTLDRTVVENTVSKKMQARLDHFKCGIQIVKVNLKKSDPPDAVRDAFNGVNRAIQIRDRIVNDAEGERNKKIPAARGAKDRAVKEAEGYKIGRLNRATGDTQAFLSVLEEYRKAEDVTRRRLYLEAMEAALPKVGELTLVDRADNGILKLLDLNRKLGKNGGAK
jgi:modulator of FtsH protease HflK